MGESREKPIRSMRDFCERYFPRRHAARECDCQPLTDLEKILDEAVKRRGS